MIACPAVPSSPVLSFLPTRAHSAGQTEATLVLYAHENVQIC